MGVKDLWDILSPVCESVSLDALKEKSVAVDLSGWILESLKQKELSKVRYPHLRNLFFRTSYLLKLGVKPLFVIEGEAPDVKRDALVQRMQLQEQPSSSVCSRKRFRQMLNECKEMIESLGLTCIQSSGEAEATCAYLNMTQVVDGCITDDSDAFLYGAKTVYRNFSSDPKVLHIEVYKMTDIETKLHLDRRKLVALALLMGCDYCQTGVYGVGKEKAMELLESLKNVDILERFEKWRNGMFASVDHSLIRKNLAHCETCKHPGTAKKHLKSGCEFCGSMQHCTKNDSDFCCDCPWHKAQEIKLELSVCQKALSNPEFPSKEIIKEFLEFKENINYKNMQWNRPSLTDFEEIIARTLCWTMEYTREKIFPLITLWQITSLKKNRVINQDFIMEPIRIRKECTRKFVKCFEVEWVLKGSLTTDNTVITMEEQQSFKMAYPRLTESYYDGHGEIKERSRKRKEKTSEKSPKKTTSLPPQSKKVSKDEEEMVFLETADVSSANARRIFQEQKGSYVKKKLNDSLEILDIPLSERLVMKNPSGLPLYSIDYVDKGDDSMGRLPQDSLKAYDVPLNISDSIDNNCLVLKSDDSHKNKQENKPPAKQENCEISDLECRLKSCKLVDNACTDDSLDELLDGFISNKEFKHSLICISSDSDDDQTETERNDNATIFSTVEDEITKEGSYEGGACSNAVCGEKYEDCEFSPLPLSERLKYRYV